MTKIPKEFTIGGLTFKVKIVDTIDDGDSFGKFYSVSQVIKIAKKVKEEEELIDVTEEQMKSTFLHELIHCFQFMIGDENFDEHQAQIFSNFICEYNNSRTF